jgi:Holliday junction DNA helicase RuvA
MSLKFSVNQRTMERLPNAGDAGLYCYCRIVEGGSPELYGFLSEDDLSFFEQLLGVSGIGPKSALAILDIADLGSILGAIRENRPDLLSRASGVGAKTASRVVLELKNKVRARGTEDIKRMETDFDLVETLITLGYTRDQAERALQSVPKEIQELDTRLKEALRRLKAQ